MSDQLDRILNDLKEKHNIQIKPTSDIESFFNYVYSIAYNEGYTDKGKEFICEECGGTDAKHYLNCSIWKNLKKGK